MDSKIFLIARFIFNGNTVGYRLIDATTEKIMDFTHQDLIKAVNNGMTLNNVMVEHVYSDVYKVKGIAGRLDRYAALTVSGQLLTHGSIVILEKQENKFKITDHTGRVAIIDADRLAQHAAIYNNVANGRVQKLSNGKIQIIPIKGEYGVSSNEVVYTPKEASTIYKIPNYQQIIENNQDKVSKNNLFQIVYSGSLFDFKVVKPKPTRIKDQLSLYSTSYVPAIPYLKVDRDEIEYMGEKAGDWSIFNWEMVHETNGSPTYYVSPNTQRILQGYMNDFLFSDNTGKFIAINALNTKIGQQYLLTTSIFQFLVHDIIYKGEHWHTAFEVVNTNVNSENTKFGATNTFAAFSQLGLLLVDTNGNYKIIDYKDLENENVRSKYPLIDYLKQVIPSFNIRAQYYDSQRLASLSDEVDVLNIDYTNLNIQDIMQGKNETRAKQYNELGLVGFRNSGINIVTNKTYVRGSDSYYAIYDYAANTNIDDNSFNIDQEDRPYYRYITNELLHSTELNKPMQLDGVGIFMIRDIGTNNSLYIRGINLNNEKYVSLPQENCNSINLKYLGYYLVYLAKTQDKANIQYYKNDIGSELAKYDIQNPSIGWISNDERKGINNTLFGLVISKVDGHTLLTGLIYQSMFCYDLDKLDELYKTDMSGYEVTQKNSQTTAQLYRIMGDAVEINEAGFIVNWANDTNIIQNKGIKGIEIRDIDNKITVSVNGPFEIKLANYKWSRNKVVTLKYSRDALLDAFKASSNNFVTNSINIVLDMADASEEDIMLIIKYMLDIQNMRNVTVGADDRVITPKDIFNDNKYTAEFLIKNAHLLYTNSAIDDFEQRGLAGTGYYRKNGEHSNQYISHIENKDKISQEVKTNITRRLMMCISAKPTKHREKTLRVFRFAMQAIYSDDELTELMIRLEKWLDRKWNESRA